MEFRQMRRFGQQLERTECEEILSRCTSGVLAVMGDNGYPYAVPLSYTYYNNSIFFHCAKTGHKLDAIQNCDKVSFCVIDQDLIVPEEYTTYYRSVIAFGRAVIMENESEIREAIERLSIKYSPDDSKEGRDKTIEGSFARMCMVRIEIEHLTGKAARELVKKG